MNIGTIALDPWSLDVLFGIQVQDAQWSIPLGIELSLPFGPFLPYIQPIAWIPLGSFSTDVFLPVGFYFSASKNTQLFYQFDYTTAGKVFGSAIGANHVMGNFELVTELGIRGEWYVSIGGVFTYTN